MGCGCNKNKKTPEQPTNEPTPEQGFQAFRSMVNHQQNGGIMNKMSMVKSFATALTSRGLTDKKTSPASKQLRVLSCFGDADRGGVLPPCEHLKESKTPGKHYCGGCGCGDKPHTWLMSTGKEYSKLDYPRLNCPLNMPGFTNYQHSAPDEANEPITRRYYIENMDFNEVLKTPITTPEPKQSDPENKPQDPELPPDSVVQQ